jgi:RNA polymerase sigma factor (sigma-70 family)
MDDRSLLRIFVDRRDEQAFAELVRRHIDMVYSAARRQVHDAADAEDVTQSVFAALATKARQIRGNEALAGWLLVATRFAALNALRADGRRRHREREAAAMKHEAHVDQSPAWDAIRPLLDAAMANLKQEDRDAITLRHFKNQSINEVAAALGISQPAAQKRVGRAVERLRAAMARNGVIVAPGALISVVGDHVLGSAPEYLAARVAHGALSAPPLAAGTSFGITKGAVALMTFKTKVATVALVVLLASVATPIVIHVTTGADSATGDIAPVAAVADAWRARFDSVYTLPPGRSLKRISAPFIAERKAFLEASYGGSGLTGLIPRPPGTCVLTWDGKAARFQQDQLATMTLGEVFKAVGDIAPQEMDIPRRLLVTPIAGDWIVRDHAPVESKRAELCEAVSDLIGAGMMLQSVPMEREVIVVRGVLGFDRTRAEKSESTVNRISFSENGRRQFQTVAQTPREMLQRLGEMTVRPVVIETEVNQVGQPYMISSYESADFSRAVIPPDGSTVDAMLAYVAAQTSLELKRERRVVSTWKLVPR